MPSNGIVLHMTLTTNLHIYYESLMGSLLGDLHLIKWNSAPSRWRYLLITKWWPQQCHCCRL